MLGQHACDVLTNAPPFGLGKSKTSKHKTKPTFKTYHFHLMPIFYISFISQPKQDESKEFFIRGERDYGVTWEPDLPCLYRPGEPGNTLAGEEHYQTK